MSNDALDSKYTEIKTQAIALDDDIDTAVGKEATELKEIAFTHTLAAHQADVQNLFSIDSDPTPDRESIYTDITEQYANESEYISFNDTTIEKQKLLNNLNRDENTEAIRALQQSIQSEIDALIPLRKNFKETLNTIDPPLSSDEQHLYEAKLIAIDQSILSLYNELFHVGDTNDYAESFDEDIQEIFAVADQALADGTNAISEYQLQTSTKLYNTYSQLSGLDIAYNSIQGLEELWSDYSSHVSVSGGTGMYSPAGWKVQVDPTNGQFFAQGSYAPVSGTTMYLKTKFYPNEVGPGSDPNIPNPGYSYTNRNFSIAPFVSQSLGKYGTVTAGGGMDFDYQSGINTNDFFGFGKYTVGPVKIVGFYKSDYVQNTVGDPTINPGRSQNLQIGAYPQFDYGNDNVGGSVGTNIETAFKDMQNLNGQSSSLLIGVDGKLYFPVGNGQFEVFGDVAAMKGRHADEISHTILYEVGAGYTTGNLNIHSSVHNNNGVPSVGVGVSWKPTR